MRKSLFDILKDNNTVLQDIDRIIELFENRNVIFEGIYGYSLMNYLKSHCFQEWPHRGHCLTLEDLLDLLEYDTIKKLSLNNIEPEVNDLILIELIYNFWYFCNLRLKKLFQDCQIEMRHNDFFLLKTIMDDVLSEFNHTTYYDAKEQKLFIIEDKPEVTAVAEIIKEDLALPVIKYNHRTLKGDLSAKKSILISLYHELEPKQRVINEFNNKLEDNLFYLCNNLDIRHNNVDEGYGKYKEYVANMNTESLEEWYDELYQMMLLAFLAIDDIEKRRQKVNKLKRDIDGA